ncbi:hypothetical protein TSUD_67500 [Trifolium subterraneum]|uniref:WRKY domain-containing protein n=1 Tax=Trifolium subterraneum TaxID=3900 RepID=A0A2Z6P8G9_TRISU|nr:hypothetical protein TSUD_67500 [Trifolium subterraneum]
MLILPFCFVYLVVLEMVSGLMLANLTSICCLFTKCLSQYEKLRTKQTTGSSHVFWYCPIRYTTPKLVYAEFEVYGSSLGLAACVVYGGAPYGAQENKLKRGVDIAIGTQALDRIALEVNFLLNDLQNSVQYAFCRAEPSPFCYSRPVIGSSGNCCRGCPPMKHVEKCLEEPTMLIVTNECKKSHPKLPTQFANDVSKMMAYSTFFFYFIG